MAARPDRKVVYLTAERFLSSFVRALADRSIGAFKAELRNADLLLIDDVHFIGGKQSTEEELFHTLAALMEDGRRVVFSADRPPASLQCNPNRGAFDERFGNNFEEEQRHAFRASSQCSARRQIGSAAFNVRD